MLENLYSFKDILTKEFSGIVIPSIQRDYALGREKVRIGKLRDNFLNSLKNAVENQKILKLDFIYGTTIKKNKEKYLIPLDGQQRLTTLFLLYWYAANKENLPEDEYKFLKNFTYKVRDDSKLFCEKICDLLKERSIVVNKNNKLSDLILDKVICTDNPTVASMLVVLDDIDKKFRETEKLWNNLEYIKFYFLCLEDMGQTDDLYIKMNSCGKPLSPFEHFKAKLIETLHNNEIIIPDGEVRINTICEEIDKEWTDLLWTCQNDNVGEDNTDIVGDAFLRYFFFYYDMQKYKKENVADDLDDKSIDTFKLIDPFIVDKFFDCNDDIIINKSEKYQRYSDNIKLFESYFNCWFVDKINKNLNDFFNNYVVDGNHVQNKIVRESETNLFKDCLENYASIDQYNIIRNPHNKFSRSDAFLLYSFIVYLVNKDNISDDDFIRRIRIVNNLIQNSSDEIGRKQRLSCIISQIDYIIKNGIDYETLNLKNKSGFNIFQCKEEIEKMEWLKSMSASDAESLFEIEDHKLLYGRIAAIGLDNLNLFSTFSKLFNDITLRNNDDGKKRLDLINRALVSFGFCGQDTQGDKLRFGSKKLQTWKTLFHSDDLDKLNQIKRSLVDLLNYCKTFIEISDSDLETISNNFITECCDKKKFNWNYYYVKYKSFRPDYYGLYRKGKEQYDILVMVTSRNISPLAYNPFLYEINQSQNIPLEPDQDIENYGQSVLSFHNCKIKCKNSEYIVCYDDPSRIDNHIDILQDPDSGIDKEDRIDLLKNILDHIRSGFITQFCR